MQIRYTRHAEERVNEREIPKSLIELALKKPDKTIEARFRRKIAQKAINNMLIRIVYEEKKGIYNIITVYYTKAERYGD